MSQRLKRWESPRRQGRNDKGKGGSARQRQKLKQLKALKQRLKQADTNQPKNDQGEHNQGGERIVSSLCFMECAINRICDQPDARLLEPLNFVA